MNQTPQPTELGLRKNVFISTYGCQMNVNDSERMYALLESIHYDPVTTPEQADLIIINSCSVREKPVHKVRSEVGKYRRLKAKNPALRIGVGGCVAQQEKGQLLKDLPLLDFVFGTDAIDELPNIVRDVVAPGAKERIVSARFTNDAPYDIETLVRNPGVATFVNITKGCDNFCSFCVVPFTRGRERSRPMADVIRDVQTLVERGVKEVTLLGQNVNSYRSEGGEQFADLLRHVAIDTDIQRIRFTSPHPKDFDEGVADTIERHRNKIMEHVHLPAQSGNTEVLEMMNRGYTREHFIQKARMMQERIPGAVFSTDMIVGFPGETEAQFQDTLSLLDEVSFEQIYAFRYSPRPFTKAAKFSGHLPEEVKQDRLARLLAKHREQSFALARKYQDQVLEVLVEEFHPSDNLCFGRTRQNKSVFFAGASDWVGKMALVRIQEAFPQVLNGELLQ
jgi:tRNA-2-methylthio-N6-dimethylallyladenosine synthase